MMQRFCRRLRAKSGPIGFLRSGESDVRDMFHHIKLYIIYIKLMPLGMAHRHLSHPELRPPKEVAQVPLNLRLVKSFVERFSVTQKQAVRGHRKQHLHVFARFQYRGKRGTYLWHFARGSFLMSDSDHGRCDQKGNSAGD